MTKLTSHNLSVNKYHQICFKEYELIDYLYENPDMDISQLVVDVQDQFNQAVELLHSETTKSIDGTVPDLDVENYHKTLQSNWHMPNEYKKFDIAEWLIKQCVTDHEMNRVAQELIVFQDRDLLDLLRFLKYLVDTCRKNNIVLGVGRGSSVSSFVLFLLGVHKINSIYYNLDFREFMR